MAYFCQLDHGSWGSVEKDSEMTLYSSIENSLITVGRKRRIWLIAIEIC